MSPGASAMVYAFGFLSATALLHFSGYVLGMAMRAQLLRLAGAAVAVTGGWLLFAA
jgi:hydrogenase/urease accessory protein HupE